MPAPSPHLVDCALEISSARNLRTIPSCSIEQALADTVLLVAAGALVLANLVAAIPGLQAARTPTALLLRSE